MTLGCGGAWTQGALLSSCEWVVLLNNDVVVCPEGIAAMLAAAETHGFASNDTYFRWSELLARGFPYVKASVLREFGAHPQLRAAAAATAAARSSA